MDTYDASERVRGRSLVALLVCGALLTSAGPSAQGTRVNGPLGAEDDVLCFGWSPGGELVFTASVYPYPGYPQPSHTVFRADVGGPPPIAPVPLGSGYRFRISPDGRWIAYDPVEDCPGLPFCFVTAPLYCAPLDGSLPAVEINADQPGYAEDYRFDAGGTRLVFHERLRGQHVDDQGLFARPADGSAPATSLTDPAGILQDWYFVSFELSPDGTHAVYALDRNAGGNELLAVPLDRSSDPVVLMPARPVLPVFQISPDSQWVVFQADLEVPGTHELFRIPITGSAPPVRLGPPLPAFADVDRGFRFTLDGTHVVFVADLEQDEVFELWTTPADPARGSFPTRLSQKPVTGGGVVLAAPRHALSEYVVFAPQFDLAPDGSTVVYRADALVAGVPELFRVPLDGSAAPVRLNQPLAGGPGVPPFGVRFHEDLERVVFAAPDELGVARPFAASLRGEPEPTGLGGPFVAGGGLHLHASEGAGFSLELTPDGASVVYLADQRTDGVTELFLAPLDGGPHRCALNGPLVAGGDVGLLDWTLPGFAPFASSPDGRWVAYMADRLTDGQVELFVTRLPLARVSGATEPNPTLLR